MCVFMCVSVCVSSWHPIVSLSPDWTITTVTALFTLSFFSHLSSADSRLTLAGFYVPPPSHLHFSPGLPQRHMNSPLKCNTADCEQTIFYCRDKGAVAQCKDTNGFVCSLTLELSQAKVTMVALIIMGWLYVSRHLQTVCLYINNKK